jgi:hypothetical protein
MRDDIIVGHTQLNAAAGQHKRGLPILNGPVRAAKRTTAAQAHHVAVTVAAAETTHNVSVNRRTHLRCTALPFGPCCRCSCRRAGCAPCHVRLPENEAVPVGQQDTTTAEVAHWLLSSSHVCVPAAKGWVFHNQLQAKPSAAAVLRVLCFGSTPTAVAHCVA